MSFSAKLTGGNIKTGQAAKQSFEQELKLQGAAELLIKVVKSVTPVRTGNLKGRWGTLAASRWQGNTLSISVVNTAPYAERVNSVGRHAGFADKGLADARSQVLSQLGVNVGHVTKQLWDKAGTK